MPTTSRNVDGFAEWLQQRSAEAGFTNQGELADAVGVGQSAVSRWLRGDASKAGALPAAESIRPLARAIGVNPKELYVRVGLLTEEEIGEPLPQREELDPRVVRLKQALKKIDQLPEPDQAIAAEMLRGIDGMIESLESMTQRFIQRLR